MKRLIAIATTALLSATAAMAAERSVSFDVPDMFCASCPYVVEAAMGGVDGVISVTTDLDQRLAMVTFDDAITNAEAIAEASTNVGYEAWLIEAES